MRLVFINQFYWPDAAATGQLIMDLAEELVGCGHQVTVVCSRGQYDDGSGRRVPKYEQHHGVEVIRLRAPGFGKRGVVGRLTDYFGFHLLVGGWLFRYGHSFDQVITLTTPPLVGLWASWVRMLKLGRFRHICWAMDLHPDCEFALGQLSPRGILGRLLDGLNSLHFRRADAVVGLGRRMCMKLQDKAVAEDRLHEIGPWARGDHVGRTEDGAAGLRADYQLSDRFVVMYSGNAGLMHTFDAICEAMRLLADDPRVMFLFVGGGKRLAELRAFVDEHGLQNFMQLPYFPIEQLDRSLAMGDVHLVTLRPEAVGLLVPCKTYGIMAAGRGILFVGPSDSDTAEHVHAADCGEVFGVDQSQALADRIRQLADDPAPARAMGARGRRWFERHADRSVCCRRWIDLLESLSQ